MRKNGFLVLSILCVVLLFSGCVSVSSSSNKTVRTAEPVRIVITESDGTTVESANVSINGQNAGTTDSNGVLTVNNFSGGQISVSKDGYMTTPFPPLWRGGVIRKNKLFGL